MNHITTRLAATGLAAALMTGSVHSAHAQGSKETVGTIFGSIIGGVIGSQIRGNTGARIVGGIAGAAIGGLIGASIGSYLDEQDRKQLAAMTRATATTGKNRYYRNSKTGVKVTTRVAADSGNCRTVEQEVVLGDGTKRTDNVQACRTSNGWKFS